ncbi:hypothetical protein VTN02DRAFT_3058 [Thermoascus thermophilus]
MRDIHAIQNFVEVENATQLSVFGLSHLARTLAPGSISILFRNDHFSTIYKHPRSHRIFTLVTDAGYANHDEVVWESLVDVNGSNAEFFSGDFRPVGAGPSGPPNRASPREPGPGAHPVASAGGADVGSPSQEQTDADYAYALALQFQEEARREEMSRTAQNHGRHASTPYYPAGHPAARGAHHRSSSSISGGGRYGRPPQKVRPAIPPRNPRNLDTRHLIPSVGATLDGPDDAPPPTYEQAAHGPPYIPPPGHPQHEASSQENLSSAYARPPPLRRASPRLPERPKEKSKDCVVM